MDIISLATLYSAKAGDISAAQRTTWQIWEVECGDTLSDLVAQLNSTYKSGPTAPSNLLLSDWPKWLSVVFLAPGAHSLPDLIQPGDRYKVKLYGAFVGTVKGSYQGIVQSVSKARIFAHKLEPFGGWYYGKTSVSGRYGILWLPVKAKYKLHVQDSQIYYLDVISRSAYLKTLTYGEVKTVDFTLVLGRL